MVRYVGNDNAGQSGHREKLAGGGEGVNKMGCHRNSRRESIKWGAVQHRHRNLKELEADGDEKAFDKALAKIAPKRRNLILSYWERLSRFFFIRSFINSDQPTVSAFAHITLSAVAQTSFASFCLSSSAI